MTVSPSSIRRTSTSGPLPAAVVVVGATGAVGSGIVEALLEAGTPVIGVARDAAALEALRERLGNSRLLETVTGSVASERAGAELAAVLDRSRRPLAGVVLSVTGPRERSRVIEQSVDALQATFNTNLFPHLVAARHLLPLLLQSQRRLPFLVIGSPSAEMPWAGYGHISVAAAALRMLVRVLHDEHEGQSVRVQMLTVGAPVRTPQNRTCACPEWPSSIDVGRRVAAVLADPHSNQPLLRYDTNPLPAAAARGRG